MPSDLQSDPFDRSGNPPWYVLFLCHGRDKKACRFLLGPSRDDLLEWYVLLCQFFKKQQLVNEIKLCRSQRRDLNPQPADYKSAALPIELRWLAFFGGENL
jgi:hypothetical protein